MQQLWDGTSFILCTPRLAWELSALLLLASGAALAQTDQSNSPLPTQLPAIEVIGHATAQTHHAGPSSSSKTRLPLRELPQSVQVITGQTIEDLGATKVDAVLDYVSGVTRGNSFGGLQDGVMVRGLPGGRGGFGADALLNGFSTVRGNPVVRDLAGVAQVSVLKGPTAALYGGGSPGGLLNVESKRPLWTFAHEVSVSAGSEDFKRAAFDSGGPLGEHLAYRLNVAAEKAGSFRDYVRPRSRLIAPALTWALNDTTTLEYVAEIIERHAPQDRGIPAVNGKLGSLPRSRFLAEPDDGNFVAKNNTQQLMLTHDWNPHWASRVGVQYRTTDLRGLSSNLRTSPDAAGNVQRTWVNADSRTDDVTVQLELKGTVHTAAIEHELLLGAENYRYTLNQRLDASAPTSPYAINIYNPVYGQARPILLPGQDFRQRQRGRAFYAQDVVRLTDDWRLMLGVRHDRHSENQFNRLTSTNSGQRLTTATSPRAGLSWLVTPNWTLFASASRSFSPTSGADVNGRPFEPEKGRAKEGGVKWENTAQTAGMTLSVFDITKQNILTADPANPRFSITAGEVRSRGVEVDFSGQLSPHWRVIASASRLNATVSRDNTLAVGKPLLGAAKFSASALLMFEDTLENGSRYRLGGGLVHVGRRLGQSITRAEVNAGAAAFYLPAYTTARVMAAWHVNNALSVSLDVDNLFDKTWYASAANSRWVMPGAGRTFNLALQARF